MSSPPRTRADRLHLLHRVDTARRAATLLRSKEEALEREQDRVAGHLARATSDWAAALGTATSLLARARALGASGELDRWVRTLPATATAAPTWQVSMGVSYPTAVACTPGPRPDLTTTAALGPAADAYAAALSAAATAAGAALAQRRLDRELAETRRRRRAVEDRLLPELEDTCRRLELHLDELDREEAQRVRTAVRIREGGR
ncbi:V-type ATP synthase subunit D [Nocardioides sp.]|uniref:V-type ATP synthase subunit D n=1 Tax=Nocardioides sp. TaxID=35761 RepID=UPI003526CB16